MWFLLACTGSDTDGPTTADSDASTSDSGEVDDSGCVAETEVCDGVNQDCDGAVDEGVTSTFYADADGYGDSTDFVQACEAPSGFVDNAEDCDDGEAAVSPGAEEVCNDEIDNDCSGDATGCTWASELGPADAGLRITGEEDFGSALAVVPGALVVGAPSYDGQGTIFVFGTDLEGDVAASDAPFSVTGSTGSGLGSALVDLGDLDGDGSPSVGVGAPNMSGGAGSAYVIELSGFGSVGTEWADAAITGTDGQGQAGTALAAGDLDGDGVPELAIGVPKYGTGSDRKGAVYLVWGPFTVNSGLAGAGPRLNGPEGARAGQALATSDLTGDGVDDLAVGAYWDSTEAEKAGAVYIVTGPSTANANLDDAGGQLHGPHNAAFAGSTLAGLGDVSGDGYGDLAIGVPGMDRDEDVDVGAVVMAYGPITATGQLGNFSRIEGASPYDEVGSVLAEADGALLIGGAGAWVQLGPWSGSMTVADASHSLDASPSALAGGAMNADTKRDLVVGDDGTVWVVFGTGL